MWSILNYVIVEVDISELFGRRIIVHFLTVDLEKIAKLVHYIYHYGWFGVFLFKINMQVKTV